MRDPLFGIAPCAGKTNYKQCEPKANGCKQWTSLQSCAEGKVCESGQCELSSLPKTTLVYEKEVANDKRHIYTYDIDTGKNQLISTLDNSLDSPGPAISPDRKWIAFSGKFRISAVDQQQHDNPIGAIWVVSVDGKRYRQVSPLLVGTDDNPMIDHYKVFLSSPKWSHDGKYIWFHTSESWEDAYGDYQFVRVLRRVSVATGKVDTLPNLLSCQKSGYPEPHPTKPWLAVNHEGCNGAASGIYIYNVSRPNQRPVLVKDAQQRAEPAGPGYQSFTFWSRDALVLEALSTWTNQEGESYRNYGYVGFRYNGTSIDGVRNIRPDFADPHSLFSMHETPDGLVRIISIRNKNTGMCSLYTQDFRNGQSGTLQLAVDTGVNLNPRF